MPATQTRAVSPMAEARKRRKLTQLQLAETVGVNRVTIAKLEAGTIAPSITLALKIAKVLKVSVETLFGGER